MLWTFNFLNITRWELEKKSIGLLVISITVWLGICLTSFLFIQENQSLAIQKSLQNQFREELRASNFLYLSRAVSDLNDNGTIKCAFLTKLDSETPLVILDLRFREGCNRNSNSILLKGSAVSQDLTSLNGDIYRLEFRTVNSSIFYVALWILILSGGAIIFLGHLLIQSQKQKTKILLDVERKVSDAKLEIARQVAHDIRSPISAINIVLSTLKENESPNSYTVLRNAALRVMEIADDLLDSSRNTKSKLSETTVTKEGVEKTDILKLINEITREKEIVKPESIKITVDATLPETNISQYQTRIDDGTLKRVLSNILNNAIEAIGNTHGEIKIHVRSYSKIIQIVISDTGQGISEELLKRIGEKGFTTANTKTGKVGNGLGIYHAKTFFNEIGGQLNITSKVGVGTNVEMIIPR